MIYIGIDPGVAGGIAAVTDESIVRVFKMPETDRDVLDVLESLAAPGCKAIIERVNAGVFGHGKAGQRMGVTSAFTFGRGVGALHMALTAARIPFDGVMPIQWQRAMGCVSGGDKNITKRRAQALFPHVTITHAIADALLMAEFCRRMERGSIQRDPQGARDGEKESQQQGAKEGTRRARRQGPSKGRSPQGAEETTPAAHAQRHAARP